MGQIFNGWHFDIKTAVITVLISPLIVYTLFVIREFLKNLWSFALEGILYWLSRRFMHSLAASLTLKRYCRLRLAEDNKYLHVPSSMDIKLEVDKVYVTLILENTGTDEVEYNHQNLLSAGNRIRLVGNPGSGKSSLVKRLLRDACYDALARPKKSRLPILIELRNVKPLMDDNEDSSENWLFDYVRTEAEKSAVYKMADCFNNYIEETGLLILLDGLDEVSSADYPLIQKAIDSLSDKLSQLSEKNVIVLTMRTQFHQQVKHIFRNSFGPALFLKPFSSSDIYEFLSRWPFHQNGNQNVARIYKELTDRPSLREMCTNPLVLSMYVAEDQARGHLVAPESRTEFYKKVTEELIIKRRLHQTGAIKAHTKLKEQREQILGRLAYEHMLGSSQPTNSLEWQKALTVIREVTKCELSEAETIFRDLAKETGIVTEEREEQTFRFIHLTFCEFLAAFETVKGQENGWTTLVTAHTKFQELEKSQANSRLAEVIPFACGLLPRIQKDRAITEVNTLKNYRLLARCFIETKCYDHSCWTAFTQCYRKSLLQAPESEWDESWLGDLHVFNAVIEDANRCADYIPLENRFDFDKFFHTIVDQQQQSLFTLLKAYASQDAAAAFRLAEFSKLDLARDFPEIVISNLDQAPFFALVCEQMLRETKNVHLWASLLSEAALQSIVVSKAMIDIGIKQSLMKYVEAVPKNKRWIEKGIIKASFYSQCLTIAVADKDRQQTPVLRIIRSAPAPSSIHWRLYLRLGYSAQGTTIVGCVLMYIMDHSFFTTSSAFTPTVFFVSILLGVPFYYTIILFQLRRRAVPRMYQRMIQPHRKMYLDTSLPLKSLWKAVNSGFRFCIRRDILTAYEEILQLLRNDHAGGKIVDL